MRIFLALALIIGCYVCPLSDHLSAYEMARYKALLSFLMPWIMFRLSTDLWSERVAYVELTFLLVSILVVANTPLTPLLTAHYGNIVTAGFIIELLLWVDGAIAYCRNHHFSFHGFGYRNSKGSK